MRRLALLAVAAITMTLLVAAPTTQAFNKQNPRWEAPRHLLLLTARLQAADAYRSGIPATAFAAVAVLVVRPVGVALATLRLPLSWRERALLMSMAPRGVLAAAFATVFGLRLAEVGYHAAGRLPLAVLTLIGVASVLDAVVSVRTRNAAPAAVAASEGANPQPVLSTVERRDLHEAMPRSSGPGIR